MVASILDTDVDCRACTLLCRIWSSTSYLWITIHQALNVCDMARNFLGPCRGLLPAVGTRRCAP